MSNENHTDSFSEKCYICGAQLDEGNIHKEHIIPNAIGGVLKGDSFLCVKCGNKIGQSIDSPFAKKL